MQFELDALHLNDSSFHFGDCEMFISTFQSAAMFKRTFQPHFSGKTDQTEQKEKEFWEDFSAKDWNNYFSHFSNTDWKKYNQFIEMKNPGYKPITPSYNALGPAPTPLIKSNKREKQLKSKKSLPALLSQAKITNPFTQNALKEGNKIQQPTPAVSRDNSTNILSKNPFVNHASHLTSNNIYTASENIISSPPPSPISPATISSGEELEKIPKKRRSTISEVDNLQYWNGSGYGQGVLPEPKDWPKDKRLTRRNSKIKNQQKT